MEKTRDSLDHRFPDSTSRDLERKPVPMVGHPYAQGLRPAGAKRSPAADRAELGTARAWSMPIPIQTFIERLSLLIQLGLPCMIRLGEAADTGRHYTSLIRSCLWQDGRLSLLGDCFSLHLSEEHIATVHLVSRHFTGECEPAVEIHNTQGKLVARIFGASERRDAAIWRDVMDAIAFAPTALAQA